jgi:hypothetical protein
MPGLSAVRASALAEAAMCCLMQNRHSSGVSVEVQSEPNRVVNVNWLSELTTEMERTWADPDEAAEDGAMALAILLAYVLKEHVVVQRSPKGTGFDYYACHISKVGENLSDPNRPFNFTKRLEISGLFSQPESAVQARLKIKIKQTAKHDDDYDVPALIGIIEFGKPHMHLLERVAK